MTPQHFLTKHTHGTLRADAHTVLNHFRLDMEDLLNYYQDVLQTVEGVAVNLTVECEMETLPPTPDAIGDIQIAMYYKDGRDDPREARWDATPGYVDIYTELDQTIHTAIEKAAEAWKELDGQERHIGVDLHFSRLEPALYLIGQHPLLEEGRLYNGYFTVPPTDAASDPWDMMRPYLQFWMDPDAYVQMHPEEFEPEETGQGDGDEDGEAEGEDDEDEEDYIAAQPQRRGTE